MLFFCVLFLLVSCSVSPRKAVTVSFSSDSPWERATGHPLPYRVKIFNGRTVETLSLEEGERAFTAFVSSDSLAVFVAYPFGSYSPYGGFWEPGGRKETMLYPEYGSFASLLLDAASSHPEAVRNISVQGVLEKVPDLMAIDRMSTLYAIFDGKLEEKDIVLAKEYTIPLEGILTGEWVNLLSSAFSFCISSVSKENTVRLFPGVWYYLNAERKMMLTIIVDEKGEYWTRLSSQPKWY